MTISLKSLELVLFEVLLLPTEQSSIGVVLVLLMDQTKMGVRYELKLWSLLQVLVWSGTL